MNKYAIFDKYLRYSCILATLAVLGFSYAQLHSIPMWILTSFAGDLWWPDIM